MRHLAQLYDGESGGACAAHMLQHHIGGGRQVVLVIRTRQQAPHTLHIDGDAQRIAMHILQGRQRPWRDAVRRERRRLRLAKHRGSSLILLRGSFCCHAHVHVGMGDKRLPNVSTIGCVQDHAHTSLRGALGRERKHTFYVRA